MDHHGTTKTLMPPNLTGRRRGVHGPWTITWTCKPHALRCVRMDHDLDLYETLGLGPMPYAVCAWTINPSWPHKKMIGPMPYAVSVCGPQRPCKKN